MIFITSAPHGSSQLKLLRESFRHHNGDRYYLDAFLNAIPRAAGYSGVTSGSSINTSSPFDLDDDPAVRQVVAASTRARATITDLNNYRWQCAKFYYKIAAIANALRAGWLNPEDQRLIWLDADTEVIKPFDDDFFSQMFPSPETHFSYLGRKDWHHLEAGIMGFNFAHEETHEFFGTINGLYLSNDVFRLQEWHDSYVIDFVRQVREEKCGLKTHNLSPDVPGLHVWPKTFLGNYLLHHKGPQRKAERYGVKP